MAEPPTGPNAPRRPHARGTHGIHAAAMEPRLRHAAAVPQQPRVALCLFLYSRRAQDRITRKERREPGTMAPTSTARTTISRPTTPRKPPAHDLTRSRPFVMQAARDRLPRQPLRIPHKADTPNPRVRDLQHPRHELEPTRLDRGQMRA